MTDHETMQCDTYVYDCNINYTVDFSSQSYDFTIDRRIFPFIYFSPSEQVSVASSVVRVTDTRSREDAAKELKKSDKER